jgi:hypothetical protein
MRAFPEILDDPQEKHSDVQNPVASQAQALNKTIFLQNLESPKTHPPHLPNPLPKILDPLQIPPPAQLHSPLTRKQLQPRANIKKKIFPKTPRVPAPAQKILPKNFPT